ncbi:MAG: D-glycero-alpha-D-manno-heptose-1,7-bisphosphate 7-phosphatase [Candidatus Glassbacteria bacterium]
MRRNSRIAAFCDRDGTIIEDVPYISDPEKVTLIPGSALAIRKLNQAGIFVVLTTNQSGLARGIFTETDLHAVNRRMEELLAREDARIDASYFCPHLPREMLSAGEEACDCRKPGVGMVKRAQTEMGIDPARSYFFGDRMSDVEMALRAGGIPYLVCTGQGEVEAHAVRNMQGVSIVKDLLTGVCDVLENLRKDS